MPTLCPVYRRPVTFPAPPLGISHHVIYPILHAGKRTSDLIQLINRLGDTADSRTLNASLAPLVESLKEELKAVQDPARTTEIGNILMAVSIAYITAASRL